ncbi:MAG TPA: thiamine phosphate synthase [Longimicrobiaceae bacterium]|nr:thiamine phosphate synthase [Longimicrobiaceae bacterium]
MSAGRLPFRLLAITPPASPLPAAAVHTAARAGGRDLALLLRRPGLPRDELRHEALALLPLCRATGTHFLLHGDPALAREAAADGVHLPDRGADLALARETLGPDALLGVSRHDAAGLTVSEEADYAALSPVFPSPGKGAPLGLDAFAEACADAPLPVVALGGVNAENASDCLAAGASAIAAIGAVWTGDPAGNVRRLLAALRR